jgi:Tfp pilus assembly protein PilW
MTLIEVLVAMAIMSLVIVSVDTSVGVLNARSNSMSQSDQAIDQLQTAEQTIVRDIHAATSWCGYNPTSTTPILPCTAFTQAPQAGKLVFNAVLDGSSWANPTSFTVQISGNQLSVTKGTTTTVLASNLDAGTDPNTGLPYSGFTWQSVTFPAASPNATYYTSIGVTLTKDSPRVGAPRITRTTTADTNVEVWNSVLACQAAWRAADLQTVDPC